MTSQIQVNYMEETSDILMTLYLSRIGMIVQHLINPGPLLTRERDHLQPQSGWQRPVRLL